MMKALRVCISIELVKLFKANITLVTLLVFLIFTPSMILGPGFSPLHVLYIEGSFCFSIIAAWIFGREFIQKTATELLVFPAPRSTVVIAKTVSLAVSVLILAAGEFVLSRVLLLAAGGTGSRDPLAYDLARHGIMTAMLLALCMPVLFLSLCGRGYFLPVSFSVAVILYVNIDSSGLPFTRYIPWCIPLVYMETLLQPFDVVILVFMGLGGLLASLAWWRCADHT
jgi:ABC-2 type transport system permease protein